MGKGQKERALGGLIYMPQKIVPIFNNLKKKTQNVAII
jgi:hypothetical protein